MKYNIQTASSIDERDAIYRFRYRIYMEELNKIHIPADHERKILFDESDESAVLYYASLHNEIVATSRSQQNLKSSFKEIDSTFFGISAFETIIAHEKIAVVDRLIVHENYRNGSLAHEMMLATYIGGLDAGTRVCFITCDDKLLHMYLRYGFRVYMEPAQLPTGEKRNRLVLFLCDKEHLQKVRSPFLPHLPENFDDKQYYSRLVKKRLGLKLSDGLQVAL